MTDIKSFYKSRVEKLEQQFKLMGSRSRRISFLRLATFIIGLVLIYVASGHTVYHVIVAAVVFLVTFVSTVIWHTKTLQRKDDLERLLKINNDEYLTLQNKFSQFDGGSEFLHPDHPFADDLDIFGDGSIFQYINRSWTVEGKQRLANWFSGPETDRDAIIQKQLAVKDLATRIDWHQNQQSTGLWLSEEKDDQPGLIQWVQKPAVFGKKIYRVLLWINPILSAFMLYLAIAGFLTPQLFVIYLMIPINIAFSRFRKVGLEHEQV
nr:hypothetical protein [Bacteroidota bacterium]